MSLARPVALARFALLALLVAAPGAQARKGRTLRPARDTYQEALFSVARPPGDGWVELPSEPGVLVLGRDGSVDAGSHPGDTWAAQVLVLPPQGNASADALKAWLQREYVGGLAATGRFEQRAFTTEPALQRGPACLRYRLAASDLGAGGALLDEHGLLCDTAGGLVIAKVSWRGSGDAAPASLASTTEAWLAGFVLNAQPAAAPAGGR